MAGYRTRKHAFTQRSRENMIGGENIFNLKTTGIGLTVWINEKKQKFREGIEYYRIFILLKHQTFCGQSERTRISLPRSLAWQNQSPIPSQPIQWTNQIGPPVVTGRDELRTAGAGGQGPHVSRVAHHDFLEVAVFRIRIQGPSGSGFGIQIQGVKTD